MSRHDPLSSTDRRRSRRFVPEESLASVREKRRRDVPTLLSRLLGARRAPDMEGNPSDKLLVCDGRACREAGGPGLTEALREAAVGSGIEIGRCRCLKACERGPIVVVQRGNVSPEARFNVTPEDAERLVADLSGKNPNKDHEHEII